MKTVVLLSGGMDSAALLYRHIEKDGAAEVLALSVNYGQRHARELVAAQDLASANGIDHEVADLTALRSLLSGSALTDRRVPVPHGHYAAESMRQTVVPMRNLIFLSVAAGVAWARGASRVATAVHAGDHAIYPDCRPAFVASVSETCRLASEGFGDIVLSVPFLHCTKADIVRAGEKLGVPWGRTWSCYEGGLRHCGLCGTCTERREAFQLAGIADPTVYAA